MGHHYIPQKYLRGFAETENPDAIWMYDKKLRRFTNPGIKSFSTFLHDAIINSTNWENINNVGGKMDSEFLTAEEVAEYLRLPLSTVYKLVQEKR